MNFCEKKICKIYLICSFSVGFFAKNFPQISHLNFDAFFSFSNISWKLRAVRDPGGMPFADARLETFGSCFIFAISIIMGCFGGMKLWYWPFWYWWFWYCWTELIEEAYWNTILLYITIKSVSPGRRYYFWSYESSWEKEGKSWPMNLDISCY